MNKEVLKTNLALIYKQVLVDIDSELPKLLSKFIYKYESTANGEIPIDIITFTTYDFSDSSKERILDYRMIVDEWLGL